MLVLAQDHGADGVALEVQRQAEGLLTVLGQRKLQHLALHDVGQAVDADDTVGHGHHGTLIAHVGSGGQAFDAGLDQFRNFCGIELHDSFLLSYRFALRDTPRLTPSGPLSFVPGGL